MNPRLPPFRTLEKVLSATTEVLARELASPSAAAPEWSALEWQIARAVAAMQGFSGLLAGQLRWRGPADWRKFLVEQEQQTRIRQEYAAQICARVDASLRRRGIGILVLKGVVLHDIGVYRPGERPMGDVDFLARPGDVDEVAHSIAELGYVETLKTRRHRVFEPDGPAPAAIFGEHPANPLKIELHTRIAEQLPIREVDITNDLWPRNVAAGIDRYGSIAALMKHLLLHAAGNMRARALRGIQLHDIAMLARRMNDTDWRALFGGGASSHWWMFPPLALTARYYGALCPAELMSMIEHDCPAVLRRAARHHVLEEVSWSKLRIQAFPGVEWSRSAGEAFAFAKSRIWPTQGALEEVQRKAVYQGIDHVVPWYGQSHAMRVARWVFSRPPRVQTMHVLQAMQAGDSVVEARQ